MDKVYYSQEDKRWAHLPYTIRNDPKQTIGTSACGPACAAMGLSSILGRAILPPETAQYAIDHGYRTDNNGTAHNYFADISEAYGLECKQTNNLDEVIATIKDGAWGIAAMRSGHFTGGGHYVSLVGAGDGWIDVFDPNKDNRKYGTDGLIDQGTKDDGKVRARESVIRREGGHYWVISKPTINEEDEAMTDTEKKAFEALKKKVDEQSSALTVLTLKVKDLESNIPAPKWFVSEFGEGVVAKIKDPNGTLSFWRSLAVSLRLQK